MKRIIAITIAFLMITLCMPVSAVDTDATVQRTALLDLSAQTTPVSSSREGWSFYPAGNDGQPLLTLNGYGMESAHSAPILLPQNCTVQVTGECYIDNAILGEQYDLITGAADGYLHVEGSGTLNLYADQFHGKGMTIALGGSGQGNEDIMTLNDVTINYYGMERDMYTAFYLQPALYAFESMDLHNVTLNTFEGGYGIWMYGHTLIGEALTEETASTLLIDGCNINIHSVTGNNWQYAKGIYTTYGNILIRNSHIDIEAGSGSFYAYKTITFDRGSNVNVMSTPVSTADSAKILYCNKLAIKTGIERVHIGCKRYIAGDVIYTKEDYVSVLGAGVTVTIGSFENGCFAGATDPNYNNWPAFEAVGEGLSILLGDVDGNGVVNANDALLILRYSLGLISSLPYPEAADVDGNGAINANDALLVLRFSLGLIDHFPAE